MQRERKVIHHCCFFPSVLSVSWFCASASPLNLGGKRNEYNTESLKKGGWAGIMALSSSFLFAAQRNKQTRYAYAVSTFPCTCDLVPCHPVLGKTKGADLSKDASLWRAAQKSLLLSTWQHRKGHSPAGCYDVQVHNVCVHKLHRAAQFYSWQIACLRN